MKSTLPRLVPSLPLPPLRDADDLHDIEAVPLERRDLPRTTWEIVDAAAENHPDAVASTWLPDPADLDHSVQYTFAELRASVQRYANVFVGLGLDRSEAVAFLTPNVSRLLPAMLGAQAAGIAAPMNPAFEADRIATLVDTTAARIIVAAGPEFDEERWSRLRSRARRMGIAAVLALRPDSARDPAPALGSAWGVNVLYLDDAALSVSTGVLAGSGPGPRDIASYFHTGGTTGAPRVAAHTHANEAFLAWDLATGVGLRPGEAILAGLPLFHVNGLMVTGLAPIVAGARSIWPGPLGWRDPSLVRNTWRLIERFGVTAMSAVPTVYAGLASVEVDADIGTLRTPIVGAAPLPTPVAAAFADRSGLRLQEGYGLTEAGCASSFTPKGSGRAGSVGQRLPYQRVAAASFDSQGAITLLAAGARGEIVISGPTVFAGYVRRSGGRAHLDTGDVVDGWLRTGDLGFVDSDERVWLTGRQKDLIIRGGHNIDPGVIEEALLAHPHVRSAGAVGRPDRRSGEVPVGFVVVDDAYEGDDLAAWAVEQIDEPAARPHTVEIVEELPLTAVGKPYKPALRAWAISTLLNGVLTQQGAAATAAARATDHGLVIDFQGSEEALEIVRGALDELAIDAEVNRHAR